MIPCWHAVVYLILFSSAAVEVPIQGSDNEIDRPQAIADIWEDLPVLHKLQQGHFLCLPQQWKGIELDIE